MKYKAIKESYGFYKKGYVKEGDICDFGPNDNPPAKLFQCMEPKPVPGPRTYDAPEEPEAAPKHEEPSAEEPAIGKLPPKPKAKKKK